MSVISEEYLSVSKACISASTVRAHPMTEEEHSPHKRKEGRGKEMRGEPRK